MARIYHSRTVRSILRDQARQLKVQGSASVLARSGMSVTGEDEVTMYGDFIVTGDFTAQGKISNEALESPVEFGVARGGATNFAVPTSSTAIASVSLIVPVGYTRALVTMTTNASVCNSTAVTDYLYLDSWIGSGDSGGTVLTGAAAGEYVSVSGGCVADLSGLTDGQAIFCQARINAAGGWGATATNIAAVNASATFLRH